MTNIDRIRVALTGFIGAPGVCTFYGTNGPSLFPAVQAMWGSLATKMPPTVSVTVEPFGDSIEDTTGAITGSWSIAPATGFAGGASGPYSAPSGACLTWLTDSVLDGRRIKGRTFLVPLSDFIYDNDGTLKGSDVIDLRATCAAYVAAAAGAAVVWHRPRKASIATPTRPARVARLGGHGVITGSSVKDKIAVLRSRRD